MTCDYAACHKQGRYTDSGWHFCAGHMSEHMAERGIRWGNARYPDDEVCGTEAGANRHRRAHEPLCGPCKAAENAAKTTRKRTYRALSLSRGAA